MKEGRTAKQVLDMKKQALGQILLIVREQRTCIEDANTDELLQCIGDRQELIDAIDALDAELREMPKREKTAEITKIEDEMRVILADISAQDTENERLAENKMDELRTQMQNIAKAKTQAKGYAGQTVHAEPLYIDKQN